MRTMLVPALLCALAQFAIAQTAARNRKITPEGCDTIYTCFAPSWCTKDTVPDMASSSIELVTEIFDVCPAVFKFYPFNNHWMRVWIESPTKVQPIEFIQNRNNVMQAKVACGDNAENKLAGSYSSSQITKSELSKATPPTVECVFDVKLKADQKVFNFEGNDKIQIKTPAGDTDKNKLKPAFDMRGCDPSILEFSEKDMLKTNLYEKVKWVPGKFFCDNPKIYKMEYRKDDGSFQQDVKLECEGADVKINNQQTTEEIIDIRCVAEAKFFCDYNVKAKEPLGSGEIAMRRVPANHATGTASVLECPSTHPYLVAKGKIVSNPSIACINYGGVQLWTINGIYYTQNGPEAYCMQELDCNLVLKITEAMVISGQLDLDGLPKCYTGGTLIVKGANVTAQRCDKRTGQYKYTTGGAEQVVTADTVFECTYPETGRAEAEAQNKENNQDMAIGVSIASILGILVVFGAVWLMARRERKRNARQAEIEQAAAIAEMTRVNESYNKYCLNKDEKKKLGKKIQAPEDFTNLNKCLMAMKHACVMSRSGEENEGALVVQRYNHDDGQFGETTAAQNIANPGLPKVFAVGTIEHNTICDLGKDDTKERKKPIASFNQQYKDDAWWEDKKYKRVK